ncbi:MAG TPA: TetR/AcrR family transcriptional regulator [Burkholderiaceae bacterium]
MDSKTSRKEQTHQRILDVAARAIRRSGYDGVGVADIMKEAGLTHGGFYAHFASRDAMLAEAIEHAGRISATTMAARLESRTKRGATPFKAYVESYLSDEHLAAVDGGCAVAALGSEMPRQSALVREASVARLHALIKGVERVLPAEVPQQEAVVIVSTLVGALQLARALGNGPEGRAHLAANRAALLARYPEVVESSEH